MALPAGKLSLTYKDYLALEAETGQRYEWLRGEAWMMAGGTLRHSAVKFNLAGELYVALRGRPCRAYDSDAKTRVDETDLSTYPDLSVVCGPVQRSPRDRHAATNPIVLIEVLSSGTERWDRGGKFHHYRHLNTLQNYVLVNPDEPRVEVFTRAGDGVWELRVYEEGDRVVLPAIDITIDMEAIYADLPEEPDDEGEAPTQPGSV